MRVLHCIPSLSAASGGPTQSLIELCRAVQKVDTTVDITVASTLFGMTSQGLDSLKRALPPSVELKLFHQLGSRTWNISPSMWRWVFNHAQEYDLLHIHAIFNPISTGCAWAARRKAVPYVLRPLGTLSEYTFAYRRAAIKQLYYKGLEARNLNGAAAIHFTTEQERQKASRLNIRVPTRVIPIPYTPHANLGAVPRDPSTVLFIGWLHPVKGLETLLQAFSLVQRQCSGAKLVIAGGGEPRYERSLRDQASRLGLSDKVIFTGFVDGEKKKQLLNTASIFMLPSYQENFGLAAVEAMAVGLPVVVTYGVDIWPDVESHRAGLVVNREADSLADAMLTLLKDSSLRDSLGRNASQLVQKLYTHTVVGHNLLDLYREVIKGTQLVPV